MILLIGGLGLLFLRNIRMASILLGLGFIYYLIVATPFLSESLTRELERRYPPLTDFSQFEQDERIPVIVLGNVYTYEPGLPENSRLSNKVLARLMEGIRVYRELPEGELVTSGGKFEGTYSIAKGVADAARLYGVDESDIVMNTEPTNTCTEAKAFVERYGTGSPVVIATSATHIPRAMMLFEQVGADPIAAPTDYEFKDDPAKDDFRWKPSFKNIDRLERAIQEHIGMVWGRYTCK